MEKNMYGNHILFDAKGRGDCSALRGKVVVTFILVDDSSGEWSQADITKFKKVNLEAGQRVLREAKGYGGELQLFLNYVRCKVNGSVSLSEHEGWVKSALRSAGLPADGTANKYLEKRYAADEASVLFCVNYCGRAFASPAYSSSGLEYAVLYKGNGDFRHELYHLFGAKDYYYPEAVKTAAEKHFRESVMLKGSESADPLTAYLMGWTDSLTADCAAFLEETASVTNTDVCKDWEANTVSGYASVPYGNGTYTGLLDAGMPNGRGRLVYADGSSYDGEWDHGTIHGFGVYRWTNGASYMGDWSDGKYHGEGTLKYPDGGLYTGSFREGETCGNGVRKYINGAVYNGEWMNGKCHGYGILVYGDGALYMGQWECGKYHGRGKLTYADGTVREGKWELGEYVGRE